VKRVPHPVCVQKDVREGGKLKVCEGGTSSQLTKLFLGY